MTALCPWQTKNLPGPNRNAPVKISNYMYNEIMMEIYFSVQVQQVKIVFWSLSKSESKLSSKSVLYVRKLTLSKWDPNFAQFQIDALACKLTTIKTISWQN